jgi:hypothetical protein
MITQTDVIIAQEKNWFLLDFLATHFLGNAKKVFFLFTRCSSKMLSL